MNKFKSLSVLSLAVLLLGACGTMDDGGGIYGPSDSGRNNYEIRGTVDSVDLNSRSVYLTNVSGYTSMLSGGGNNVRVYFDDRTTVSHQGQTYRPQDLERGDEVLVRVDESGNSLLAESMTVTRDVSGGTGTTYPSDTYGTTLRGTVRYVDPTRRTIELDRGYGSTVMVEYAASIPVLYNSRTYQVADLERGDEVEIRVRDLGSNRYMAQDNILVTRSISAGTGSGSSSTQLSTVRGTVRYVDPTRRTIELESTSWISGFNTGAGTGSRMVFSFDNNVGVDVSGQVHPVSGLEPGDVVEVQFRNTSGNPLAERIFLVRDVRR